MALPGVDIEIQNGGLGLVSNPDDRVVGLILNGAAASVSLEQPKQIFSYKQFQDEVVGGNVGDYPTEMLRQVEEFYKVAGTGAELWVMVVLVSQTTSFVLTDKAKILLDAADGRINVLGLSRFRGEEQPDITLTLDLDGDLVAAFDEAQALALDYANRHMPLRIILDGRDFTGVMANIPNLKTYTYNRVAINVATTQAAHVNSSMGLLLGRIASIPVHRNIGRVKDGAVPTDTAYLTSGETVKAFGLKATALHDKGFIFLRRIIGKAGFYWNDDHMMCADTDDYFSLAHGRVIDKASRIIYNTFIDEVLDTVPVDDKGKIVKTALKQYQEKAERAIGLTMGVAGEISFVDCFIDPNQDILATSELHIDVRVTPMGTNRVIKIKLGLFNPATA